MTAKSPTPKCAPSWPREIAAALEAGAKAACRSMTTKKPFVILVAGVNGTGKTTTIGKLARRLAGDGKKVVLAAGDTFRAAAIEQLGIWAGRAGAEFVAGKAGGDAAGLAFEALEKAQRDNADILLIDTAGRLQNKARSDGGTGKDRPRAQEARPKRAPCRAAGAGRHHRPERALSGRGLQGGRAADGLGHDQAGRHRQGRHPGGAGGAVRACRCITSAWAKARTICSPSTREPFAKLL